MAKHKADAREKAERFAGPIGIGIGNVQLKNWTKATMPVRVVPGPEQIKTFPNPPGFSMAGTNAANPNNRPKMTKKGK